MGKVLQINLNHCAVAQDLLFQLIREEKADIVIISEQYRDLSETKLGNGWHQHGGHLGIRRTSHIQKNGCPPAQIYLG